MALVGGGGAPHTAGSNPAGTGSSINYIGQHAYAYSGVINVNNVETIMLMFTTGNQYIVGEVQFNTSSIGGDDYLYKIKLNGEVIQEYVTIDQADRARPDSNIPILLPPYSKVELTAQNVTDTSGNDQIVGLVGRVY